MLKPGASLKIAKILTAAAALALSLAACAQAPPPGGEAATGHSPGCGRAAPAQPPAALTLGGRRRGLIVAVPAGYRPDRPHDLVLAFHGRTNPNEQVRGYYDLEAHAARPTVFAYPAGLPAAGGGFSWSDPGDGAGSLRDYALFDAVLAELGSRYCIDPGRVFLVGHSLGAWFVNSLACARGDRVRAVASVAGGIRPSSKLRVPVSTMYCASASATSP